MRLKQSSGAQRDWLSVPEEVVAMEQTDRVSVPSATDAPFEKRDARAVAEGASVTVNLRRKRHEWTLDEPAEVGGSDLGPTPVNAFLGALSACMIMTFQMVAERREVPIARIEARARANPNRRIDRITLELDVWSPASAESVLVLKERAERGCYVSQVIKPEIEYQVDLRVHPVA